MLQYVKCSLQSLHHFSTPQQYVCFFISKKQEFQGCVTLKTTLVGFMLWCGLPIFAFCLWWSNSKIAVYAVVFKFSVFQIFPQFFAVANYIFHAGMMVYRIFRNTSKLTAKLIHTNLMILAFVASVVGRYQASLWLTCFQYVCFAKPLWSFCYCSGLVAVFQFHNHKGIPNMYSLHSWCGMTTILMFGLQVGSQ